MRMSVIQKKQKENLTKKWIFQKPSTDIKGEVTRTALRIKGVDFIWDKAGLRRFK